MQDESTEHGYSENETLVWRCGSSKGLGALFGPQRVTFISESGTMARVRHDDGRIGFVVIADLTRDERDGHDRDRHPGKNDA